MKTLQSQKQTNNFLKKIKWLLWMITIILSWHFHDWINIYSQYNTIHHCADLSDGPVIKTAFPLQGVQV